MEVLDAETMEMGVVMFIIVVHGRRGDSRWRSRSGSR